MSICTVKAQPIIGGFNTIEAKAQWGFLQNL